MPSKSANALVLYDQPNEVGGVTELGRTKAQSLLKDLQRQVSQLQK